MRTLFAFLFGALLVAGAWLVQNAGAAADLRTRPAVNGPAILGSLGEAVPDFAFRTVDGQVGVLGDLLERGPVVVAVRDASCPVSRRYGPNLAALEDELAPLGVQFLYVNVAQADPEDVREAEIARFGFDGPYALDRTGGVRRALQPQTTTEVFLIDPEGILRYRGAVDDQHGYDFARPESRHAYLRDATHAVAVGERPPVAATFASGCYLVREGRHDGMASAHAPTYNGEVRAILQENCVSCHREGGTGPVALTTYREVLEHQDRIRDWVNHDRMPPWPAVGVRPWSNDRRLTPDEKLALLDWLSSGAPEGDAADSPAPSPTRWRDGWMHGTPDAVLEMTAPFEVPPDRDLGFRTFVIPTDFGEDRWVSRVEILPSVPDAVLHVIAVLDDPQGSEDVARDAVAEALKSYFAGWAPGYDGNVFPPGTAKLIPAGAVLKLHVQYIPGDETVVDRTRVGLHFTDAPSRGVVETRSAYAIGFEIPPGATNHEVRAEYRFADAGEIVSLTPHMLHRGAAVRYVLWRPDGSRELLLDIPRFYPAFRFSYAPVEPITVEAGSVLQVTGWYDNSEANPRNPDPSRPVESGIRPSQEVLVGWFDFVPGQASRAFRSAGAAGDSPPDA